MSFYFLIYFNSNQFGDSGLMQISCSKPNIKTSFMRNTCIKEWPYDDNTIKQYV